MLLNVRATCNWTKLRRQRAATAQMMRERGITGHLPRQKVSRLCIRLVSQTTAVDVQRRDQAPLRPVIIYRAVKMPGYRPIH